MRFIDVTSRHSIDTDNGRLWVEPGDACLVYSRGQDNDDDRAERHSDDGGAGDIVYWPPDSGALARAGPHRLIHVPVPSGVIGIRPVATIGRAASIVDYESCLSRN